MKMEEVQKINVMDFVGMTVQEAKQMLYEQEMNYEIQGAGESIVSQFPQSGEEVNKNTTILLYTE